MKRAVCASAFIASAVVGCGSESESGQVVESVQEKMVIWGTDDRREPYTRSLQEQFETDSVVATFNAWNTIDQGNGWTTLDFNQQFPSGQAAWSFLSEADGVIDEGPLCANESFFGQPRFLYCSGVLVAPNLVLTANHCAGDVGNTSVQDFRFVFHFRMDGPNQPRTVVPTADIYAGKVVVASSNNMSSGNWSLGDWSLVELTRSVPNHRIAPLRRTGNLADGVGLFQVGHPAGLPMKFVANGSSRNGSNLFFESNLDLSNGNSGGPVFNAATRELEGVVSSSPVPRWVWDANTNCYRSNTCTNAGTCEEGSGFAATQRINHAAVWTPGNSSTYLANINAATMRADLISVTWGGVWVRTSTGVKFNSGHYGYDAPFYGTQGTFFADLDNDQRDDLIAVNWNGVAIRKSNGTTFENQEDWIVGGFYGDHGTFLADVTGDHRADIIAVNWNGVTVRRNVGGTSFGSNEIWSSVGYFGTRGTFFADIDGDERADAIVVNDNGISVRRSSGSHFAALELWSSVGYFGEKGTYFADVTGDGKADAIVVNSTGITVRRAPTSGIGFGANEIWSNSFLGTRGQAFGDVTGDGKADAVVIREDGASVRTSSGSAFSSTSTKWVTFAAGSPGFGDIGAYASAMR